MIKKIITQINPIAVIKALKKTDKAHQIEGITQMGGGGLLISSGVALVYDGANNQNFYELIGGAILLIIGVYLAKNLTEKIEKINCDEKS